MTHRFDSIALAALACGALFPAAVVADDIPALRKGLWEYKRTVPGKGDGGKDAVITTQKCVDPVASMKAMSELLANKGCTITPPTMKGNVRTSASECPVQGTSVRSESVMTFEGDSAYHVEITTTGRGKSGKETLAAKRVGDC